MTRGGAVHRFWPADRAQRAGDPAGGKRPWTGHRPVRWQLVYRDRTPGTGGLAPFSRSAAGGGGMLADGRLQRRWPRYGRRAIWPIDAPKSLGSICFPIWMRKHPPRCQWHGRKSSRLARGPPAAVDGDWRRAWRPLAGRHRRSQRWGAADGEDATPITAHRLGEGFEALRDAVAPGAAHGQRPRIFIAALGTPAHGGASISPQLSRRRRVEALDGQGAPDEIAAAFTASGLDLAIICGSINSRGRGRSHGRGLGRRRLAWARQWPAK